MQSNATQGGAVQTKSNIAARAGRWSAKHRKAAIFGWLAFVLISVAIGSSIGTKTLGQSEAGNGESGRADQALNQQYKRNHEERILVQSRAGTNHDREFQAGVRDVIHRLRVSGSAVHIKSGIYSEDGRSALVVAQVKNSANDVDIKQANKVDPLLKATAAAQRAHPSLRIEQFGDYSLSKALDKAMADDFSKAQKLSLPITLAILVIAFGSLVAAGIPVLLAITGVMATIGLISIPSQFSGVDQAINEVVLLVGMAVGVDYSLFYLRREREERAAGKSSEAALEAAAATSGRSVLISGLTVMVAMAGMYLTGDKTFASFATGTILVVAVAVIGSLTVLPAVLSKLGDKVMKGRVPFIARRREQGRPSRLWSAMLRPVLRHPVVAAVASAAVLVGLTIPAFSLHTGTSGADGIPQSIAIKQTFDRMQKAFPGNDVPAQVVVQAKDVTAPAVTQGIGRLERQAVATGEFHKPTGVDVAPNRKIAVVSIPIAGHGTDARSDHALTKLRDDVIPATIGKVAGTQAQVTGMTAQSKDFNDSMKASAPLVVAFVLAMAFVLLLVTFRSIVIPLKAIVLNLLSVGAAYGVLVLVFQKTWAEGLLGFKSTGSIEPWLPMFLFVILFGLSMDYHVFIISRIREAFDRGMKTEDAVEHGIKATAGVVTSAAVVMVAVFAIFGSLGALMLKQMGVGLAAAVLIDATIIRAVLLPASMKLLGDWNWYLPKRLEWLPRIRHEEPAPEPSAA
jgi:RND superfamily putative drug exporter